LQLLGNSVQACAKLLHLITQGLGTAGDLVGAGVGFGGLLLHSVIHSGSPGRNLLDVVASLLRISFQHSHVFQQALLQVRYLVLQGLDLLLQFHHLLVGAVGRQRQKSRQRQAHPHHETPLHHLPPRVTRFVTGQEYPENSGCQMS